MICFWGDGSVKEYIETVLAPRLQGDGGWVEFVSCEAGVVTLVFRGECSKCGILDRCTAWMEAQLERRFDTPVRIRAVRKKPYFWDNK